jgi:hypothetical protein
MVFDKPSPALPCNTTKAPGITISDIDDEE